MLIGLHFDIRPLETQWKWVALNGAGEVAGYSDQLFDTPGEAVRDAVRALIVIEAAMRVRVMARAA